METPASKNSARKSSRELRSFSAELKRRNAYNSRRAAAPALLFFGANAQDRDGSASYRRADPCAESIRYTPGVVFDS